MTRDTRGSTGAVLLVLATLWGGCQSDAARDDAAVLSTSPEAGSGEAAVEPVYQGKAVFAELEHDFGKVYPEDKVLKHLFRFRNEGEKSLRIEGVNGS